MISNEEIEAFLHGNDPEEFIVAIEFDYATNSIYKIREIPGKGKEIKKDTFVPFAWVGDLKGLNFYNDSKAQQKEAMSKYGIVIEKLDTHGDERLKKGLTFIVKSLKGYRELIQFFRDGSCDPWSNKAKSKLVNSVDKVINKKTTNKSKEKMQSKYNDAFRKATGKKKELLKKGLGTTEKPPIKK